ncbi:hypothetical protein [Anaerosporobacter sp.]|uniref:hypothetical protein n=1 Tax=Anaerosporobacter sp. TaxID=1872529 RepID=UPI00286F1C2D|nr:hypothetical protein [Anaerosporobacter sp.]
MKKRILRAVISLVILISIVSVQYGNVYAANKTTKKTLSQEEAMSKYLTKKAVISYKNKSYTVYKISNQITPKADDYTVLYFDQKGNLVNSKSVYIDLQRLYIMGTCKEPLQTYKKLNGTIIPDLIFGQKAVEIAGALGIKIIVSKGELVKEIIAEGLKDGALDFDNASIIWASNEWFGKNGLESSLDVLYGTKKGISASKTGSIYTISDNYNYHRSMKVSDLYSKWLNTYFRYASFLSSLDNLGLTVQASNLWDILGKVALIFADTLTPTLGDIPGFKEEYGEYIGYFILKDISVAWDAEKGIKIVPDGEEIVESLYSFFDNLMDYSSTYEDKANRAYKKQKSSAETSYITRQTSASAEAVIRSVNPKFVLPPRK